MAERVALLLCVLRIIPSDATKTAAFDAGLNLARPWVETLEEVYLKLAPHTAAYADGLVSMCVEVCRLLGPVDFGCEQREHYGMTSTFDDLF